jgi:predicted enzyme related to lactoylglutathione lyase
MRNPICWFEIYVDDMERAKRFYQGVFGCELTHLSSAEPELWQFPANQNGYGTSGALVKMEGFSAGHNSTVVYFSCEDCAAEQNRVAQYGGKIFREKFSIGEYGFIALATDTEGNMIGLHSLK